MRFSNVISYLTWLISALFLLCIKFFGEGIKGENAAASLSACIKTVEGLLTRHPDFTNIDMSQGEWLVLARTRFMLNELEEVLYQKGLFYKKKISPEESF